MPQNPVPGAAVGTFSPVNTAGTPEPISLSYGSMVQIGAPGMVLFTNYGSMVLSAIGGARPVSGAVQGR